MSSDEGESRTHDGDEDENRPDEGRSTGESSDGSETVDQPKRCANCGDGIDTDEWHPVATRRDGDDFELFAFCSEDCRDAWDGGEPAN